MTKRKTMWRFGLPALLALGIGFAAVFWKGGPSGEVSVRPAYDFTKEFAKEFWCVQECFDAYEYESLYINNGLGGKWGKLTVTRTGEPSDEPLGSCLSNILLADRWKRAGFQDAPFLPDLFDAKAGQYSDGDLSFTATSEKKQPMFFNLRIWIADDESTAVLYLETGW